MRLGPILAAVALASLTAACSKSQDKQAESEPAPSATAPSAPAPSDAEKQALLASYPAPYGAADLANGKAKFVYADPVAMPEQTDAQFPLLLLTGRGSSAQWHTETRTKKSDVLRKLHPNVFYVEINPQDAKQLALGPRDWVRVRSARGMVEARAFITHVVQPGQVFMPMHHSATNQLTFPAFDPYSRQPSYKACAVRLERLDR